MWCDARRYMKRGVMWHVLLLKCGAMLDMMRFEVCCERCWCDMKCAIWWGMMVWRGMGCSLAGIMSEMVFDVEWCNVKCGGNEEVRDAVATSHLYLPHLTTTAQQYFTIKPHFRHSTRTIPHHSHHTTFTYSFNWPPDHTSHGVMWNSVAWHLVRCWMFCNADVGCCALFILMWL